MCEEIEGEGKKTEGENIVRHRDKRLMRQSALPYVTVIASNL